MKQDLIPAYEQVIGAIRASGARALTVAPFVPEGAGRLWFVLKGYVDLFTLGLEHGNPSGARSFFTTVEQNELLFGMARVADVQRSFFAVPSGDAEILEMDADTFDRLRAISGLQPGIAFLADRWIDRLSGAIARDNDNRCNQLIVAGVQIRAGRNEKIRARKGVAWAGIETGSALFLGLNEITPAGGPILFPLTQDSWLQTLEPTAIRPLSTPGLLGEKEFLRWMDSFHTTILETVILNSQFVAVDEINRLNEKATYRETLRSRALFRIASVVNEKLAASFLAVGEDPLFLACRYVAEYAGISVAMPKRPKREEMPPLTLSDITFASKFRTREVRLAGDWIRQDNGPLLAFTQNSNHPVALIPASRGGYRYISPAENIRQPLTASLAAGLNPLATQFYRPFPDRPVTVGFLMKFALRGCSRDIRQILTAGLAGGLLSMLVPVLTGAIFDTVIPRSDFHQLWLFSGVILLSIAASALFQLIRSFSMIRIETRLDYAVQSAVWDRLLNLPLPFFREYQAGELAAKANSIMALRKVLSETVIYSVLGSVFMVFNLFLLFWYMPRLALLITVILAAAFLMIVFTGRRIEHHQQRVILLQNRLFGMLIQFLSSISKIRIAGAEVHAFSLWAELFSAGKQEAVAVRKRFIDLALVTSVLPLLVAVIVFALTAADHSGTLTTGRFMAFYTAMTMTVLSFTQLMMAVISWFTVRPMAESIRPILETVPESVNMKPQITELTGDIEVANVFFRYHPEGPYVLQDVSLHVHPNEFIAIVGASGSGKSTLLRLLLGFEAPVMGSIYYDRQALASVDPASVRRQTGTVLQQSQVMAGTILSNIVGITRATPEEAWEAARNVALDQDIREMPMGMHTVITGGLSTLSGGQRQRIMIARAIVNRPRILFFDEATSALDNKTQQIVSQSLETLQATRIVIAHRLSTIRNADRIYVMENGGIAETGTYRELIDKGGIFRELVQRQMIDAAEE